MGDSRFEPTFAAPAPDDFSLAFGVKDGLLYGGVFTIFAAGILASGWMILRGSRGGGTATLVGSFVLCAGVLFLAGAWLNVARVRLEKRGDRLFYRNLWGTRSLAVSEIAGYTYSPKSGYVLRAQPASGKKNLVLPPRLVNVPAFKAWAERALKNEDALVQNEEDAEALRALGGADAPLRYERVKRDWRRIQLASMGAAGVTWLGHFNGAILISCAGLVAVFAYMARFHGVIRLDGSRWGGAPKAMQCLAFLFMAAGARGAADFFVLDLGKALVLALIGAVALTAFIARVAAPRATRLALLPYFGFAAFFAYGLLVEANGKLDGSVPETYTTRVSAMEIHAGKHRSYNFRVEPWGPVKTAREIDVGPATYGRAHVGDRLEMWLRKGALGIQWYSFRLLGPAWPKSGGLCRPRPRIAAWRPSPRARFTSGPAPWSRRKHARGV